MPGVICLGSLMFVESGEIGQTNSVLQIILTDAETTEYWFCTVVSFVMLRPFLVDG